MIELHIALGKFLQKRECNIYQDQKTTRKKVHWSMLVMGKTYRICFSWYTHMLLEVIFLSVLYTVTTKLEDWRKGLLLPYDFVHISNNQDEINEKKENILIEIHHTLRLLIIYLLHALINRKN